MSVSLYGRFSLHVSRVVNHHLVVILLVIAMSEICQRHEIY